MCVNKQKTGTHKGVPALPLFRGIRECFQKTRMNDYLWRSDRRSGEPDDRDIYYTGGVPLKENVEDRAKPGVGNFNDGVVCKDLVAIGHRSIGIIPMYQKSAYRTPDLEPNVGILLNNYLGRSAAIESKRTVLPGLLRIGDEGSLKAYIRADGVRLYINIYQDYNYLVM